MPDRPWRKLYAGRIPEEPIGGSLGEFFDAAVSRHAGHTALTDGARRLTYAQLGRERDRLAAGLGELGVGRGDRIALVLPNCVEYVLGFFATIRLGAVVTQVNPMYTAPELAHILADSGAQAAIVHAAAYARVREARTATALRVVVVVGEPEGGLADGDVSFTNCVASDAPAAPEVKVDPLRDLASLQYTGGTTGVSKGAMLTHANLLGAIEQTSRLLIEDKSAVPAGSAAVAVAPLFHIFGLTMVLLLGLRHGWNLLLVARFDVDELLALIERERPVALAGVTTIYTALNGHPDAGRFGLDDTKLYLSGGASVPAGLADEFRRLTGRPIWEGYGMSEGAPLTFNTYLAGPRPGSVGVPVPGTDVRIVDLDTGTRDLPPGAPGELVVRGPQVMRGYWRKPEETALALRDGWLYTGDVAVIDKGGFLSIVDRKKEMINSSGYKVYPREVEEVLYSHPAVLEAVVIGVADDYRGEAVKGFIVLKQGSATTREEIIAHCRQSLAAYKIPRQLEFRDALPKSAVGKLLRRLLIEEERANRQAGDPTPI